MKKSEKAVKSAGKNEFPANGGAKEAKRKRNRKDRRDARWVKEADAMHHFMPYLIPNRADNEAVMNPRFDLTNVLKYLEEKNKTIGPDGYRYTIFHVITAAVAKTIYNRPVLNRFIQGHRLYERNEISFAFVVKKKFADDGAESLQIIKVGKPGSIPVDDLYNSVKERVMSVRHRGEIDGSTDVMSKLIKMPRFLLKFVSRIIMSMDYHGTLPKSLSSVNPYDASVFISNLGSIKMRADYHHLANFGTNSFFLIINQMQKTPVFNDDGTFTMRDTIDVSITIDERIADGIYFGNSIKYVKKLLDNPYLLELPIESPIE